MDPQKDHSAFISYPVNHWIILTMKAKVLIQKTWYHIEKRNTYREEIAKLKTLLMSLVFKQETNVKIPVRCHNIRVAEETSSTAPAYRTRGNIPSRPAVNIQIWSLPQHYSPTYTRQEFGLKYHENFFSFHIWDLFVLWIFTFKRMTFSRSSTEPCEIETEKPTPPCNPMTSWLCKKRKIILRCSYTANTGIIRSAHRSVTAEDDLGLPSTINQSFLCPILYPLLLNLLLLKAPLQHFWYLSNARCSGHNF